MQSRRSKEADSLVFSEMAPAVVSPLFAEGNIAKIDQAHVYGMSYRVMSKDHNFEHYLPLRHSANMHCTFSTSNYYLHLILLMSCAIPYATQQFETTATQTFYRARWITWMQACATIPEDCEVHNSTIIIPNWDGSQSSNFERGEISTGRADSRGRSTTKLTYSFKIHSEWRLQFVLWIFWEIRH